MTMFKDSDRRAQVRVVDWTAGVKMIDEVPCTVCGAMILPATAAANGGLCAPCSQGFRQDIEEGKRWHAERKAQLANRDPATKHWRWLVAQVHRVDGGFAALPAENQRYFEGDL